MKIFIFFNYQFHPSSIGIGNPYHRGFISKKVFLLARCLNYLKKEYMITAHYMLLEQVPSQINYRK